MTVVVDTNVAVAANGGAGHVDDLCRRRCVERLKGIVDREVVAVDEAGFIFKEYGQRLAWAGGPSIGDMFFKHVHNHQHRDDRVRRVPVTPLDDEGTEFEELPETTFDRSDRKFLVVAKVARATVVNATDSDWSEHRALTDRLGVKVEELCPQHVGDRRRDG